MAEVSQKSNVVQLNFTSDGKTKTLAVTRSMSLREVQQMLCSAFRQRFPLMCANLKQAGELFDNFDDMPFVDAEDAEDIIVTFDVTSDMYFFDLFDRKKQPSSDPFDDVPELSLE